MYKGVFPDDDYATDKSRSSGDIVKSVWRAISHPQISELCELKEALNAFAKYFCKPCFHSCWMCGRVFQQKIVGISW